MAGAVLLQVTNSDTIAGNYPCSSCKEIQLIQQRDFSAASGEYSLKTSHGNILQNVSGISYHFV